MAYVKHIPHLCVLRISNCPTRKKPHAGMFLNFGNRVTLTIIYLVAHRLWVKSLFTRIIAPVVCPYRNKNLKSPIQEQHLCSYVTSGSLTGKNVKLASSHDRHLASSVTPGSVTGNFLLCCQSNPLIPMPKPNHTFHE